MDKLGSNVKDEQPETPETPKTPEKDKITLIN